MTFSISRSDIDLAHLNWAENQPFSFDLHVAVIERGGVVIKLIHCITFPCTKSTITGKLDWLNYLLGNKSLVLPNVEFVGR